MAGIFDNIPFLSQALGLGQNIEEAIRQNEIVQALASGAAQGQRDTENLYRKAVGVDPLPDIPSRTAEDAFLSGRPDYAGMMEEISRLGTGVGMDVLATGPADIRDLALAGRWMGENPGMTAGILGATLVPGAAYVAHRLNKARKANEAFKRASTSEMPLTLSDIAERDLNQAGDIADFMGGDIDPDFRFPPWDLSTRNVMLNPQRRPKLQALDDPSLYYPKNLYDELTEKGTFKYDIEGNPLDPNLFTFGFTAPGQPTNPLIPRDLDEEQILDRVSDVMQQAEANPNSRLMFPSASGQNRPRPIYSGDIGDAKKALYADMPFAPTPRPETNQPAGAFILENEPWTGESRNRASLFLNEVLSPDELRRTAAHELAHMGDVIDPENLSVPDFSLPYFQTPNPSNTSDLWIDLSMQLDDARAAGDLDRVAEIEKTLSQWMSPWMLHMRETPENFGYSRLKVPKELTAEFLAAFNENPAFVRQMYPEALAAIRQANNANPNRAFNINQILAPLATTGALGAITLGSLNNDDGI